MSSSPTSVAGPGAPAAGVVAGAKPSAMPHFPDMAVPPKVVAEILLTCTSMGTVEVDPAAGREVYVPTQDCRAWLADLQRVLGRDHAAYRPVGLLLGKWKVAAQKLLPLAAGPARHDRKLVLTVCKILTILTKPLSAEAQKAGRLVLDVRSGKVDDAVLAAQRTLRDNALAQADLLVEYKALFVRHPSHRHAFRTDADGDRPGDRPGATAAAPAGRGRGLLATFTGLLAEPLARIGSARTAEDHLAIELVLHLVRNLLSIAPLGTFGSAAKAQAAAQLHRDLLIVLKEEMVLDLLVCVGQEVERRENSGYNLLLMEILSHALRGQDPTGVALSVVAPPSLTVSTRAAPAGPQTKSRRAPAKTRVVRTVTAARASGAGAHSLRAHLQAERHKTQALQASRHSYFGGTLSVSQHGRRSYVSASDRLARTLDGAGAARGAAAPPPRRRHRKAEAFVGAGTASAAHSRPGMAAAPARDGGGPRAARARRGLHEFCARFLADCYGPVMKSLKNEFRRDSSRLERGDKVMFFRLVWFFHQWHRVGRERNQGDGAAGGEDAEGDDGRSAAGSLVFTMDVFMFNLVLGATDEYFEHKRPAALAQAAALYAEMLRTLRAMYDSADATERTMALGLMDRLYYAHEPLDRLPRLLSRWAPGMFSREYLCDLVEMTHVTLKLLDDNAVRCRDALSGEGSERPRPKDAVERMNLVAADFDRDKHFLRRFVTNQIIFMYTQLLSQHAVNAAHVNRHIVAYFIRLCKFSLKDMGDHGEDLEFDDALGTNPLAAKASTLEPILYNIGLITTLEKLLNDPALRDKEDYKALLMFAASFMKRFAVAAENNPMLYVEALFKHPILPRFCELSTNVYVNEELRMIAVRDLLLEDQKRYEQEAEAVDEEPDVRDNQEDVANDSVKGPGYDDDEEEEELEFNDDDADIGIGGVAKKKRRRKNRKSRRSMLTDRDSSEDEEENEVKFPEGNTEGAAAIDDENKAPMQQNEKVSAEVDGPPAAHEGVDDASSLDVTEGGPTQSGKTSTSKSQELDAMEEPSEEAAGDNEDEAREQQDVVSSEMNGSPAAHEEEGVHAPSLHVTEDGPTLSGKKRIRKSQEADADEESDEEDFLGLSVSSPPSKVTKRVIFDDDDDD